MYPIVAHLPFAAAVAAATTNMPRVSNVLAQKEGGWYSVRYTPANGIAIALESTRTAAAAVARFVEAASVLTSEQTAPLTFTDAQLSELPKSFADGLPLSPYERVTCAVFPIGPDLSNVAHTGSRLAVARPVTRQQLAGLPCGQVLLYTEVYAFPESDEYPEGSTAHTTCLGQLRRYDSQRGLLYASCWQNGTETEGAFEDADVAEVWAVERFVAAT